jgi:hypothetical protein
MPKIARMFCQLYTNLLFAHSLYCYILLSQVLKITKVSEPSDALVPLHYLYTDWVCIPEWISAHTFPTYLFMLSHEDSFKYCWFGSCGKSSQTFQSKSSIFWDIAPCSPLKVNQHFEGTCHLYLQSWIISQESKKPAWKQMANSPLATSYSCWFLAWLIF